MPTTALTSTVSPDAAVTGAERVTVVAVSHDGVPASTPAETSPRVQARSAADPAKVVANTAWCTPGSNVAGWPRSPPRVNAFCAPPGVSETGDAEELL